MNSDRSFSLPLTYLLLTIVIISLNACETDGVDSVSTATPTQFTATPASEPTRTPTLHHPDTARETSWAEATEKALITPSLTPKPSRTPSPTMRATSTDIPTVIPTITRFSLGELTLEDYALLPESEFIYSDRSDVWDLYIRIPDPIYYRWVDWGDSTPEPRQTLSEVNQKLSAFGYRLEETKYEGGRTFYGLFEGQDLVQDDIQTFHIMLNQSRTDFALIFYYDVVSDLGYARKGFVDPGWETSGGYAWLPNVDLAFFIGDDLIRVDFMDSPVVIRNDEIIYTHNTTYRGPDHCPLMLFQRWKNQWVMEVEGEIVLNGELLHQKYGYDRAFYWHLLNGKPLFFFEKGGNFGISYDGQILPIGFDQIIYPRCGEMLPTLGPYGNSRIMGFYGLKDGYWRYFELRAF